MVSSQWDDVFFGDVKTAFSRAPVYRYVVTQDRPSSMKPITAFKSRRNSQAKLLSSSRKALLDDSHLLNRKPIYSLLPSSPFGNQEHCLLDNTHRQSGFRLTSRIYPGRIEGSLQDCPTTPTLSLDTPARTVAGIRRCPRICEANSVRVLILGPFWADFYGFLGPFWALFWRFLPCFGPFWPV